MKQKLNLKNINRNKTYFITGAVGFIGFFVSKRLLELGCIVIGLDNLNDYYDVKLKEERLKILSTNKKFVFYKNDLENNLALEKIFEEHEIDIVIHLAAQAGVRYSLENPRAYISSNIVGFFNVIELSKKYNIEHFLFASSSSVYGANKKVPYSVEDKTDCPVSLYAATKKCDELIAYTYAHLFNMPTTGMRFFTVYGPYGRPDMAYFSFTKNILAGKPIKIFNNGDMYRDFTYIDDVVEGIIRLINNSRILNDDLPFKVYNIGNHRPEKLLYFIEVLEKCLGCAAIKEYYPMQAGDVYKTYADINDIKNDIDFTPTTQIEVGVEKFISWYKSFYVEKKRSFL